MTTPAETATSARTSWRDAFFTTRTCVTVAGRRVLVRILATHIEQQRRATIRRRSGACRLCATDSVCPSCLRAAVAAVLLRRQDRHRGRRLTAAELADQVADVDLTAARSVVNDYLANHPLPV